MHVCGRTARQLEHAGAPKRLKQAFGLSDEFLLLGSSPASDCEPSRPFAPFAQSLALLQSLSLGMRPDHPNAADAVIRVATGIFIYPAQTA